MRSVEKEGKTVEEAVELALQELGATKEEVVVEIVEEGSKGLFGLVGSKKAKVKVSVQTEGIKKAEEVTKKMLDLMGLTSEVKVSIQDDHMYVEIAGNYGGLLIGKKGETLSALQYIVSRLVNRGEEGNPYRVVVDAEGYRKRREAKLIDMARKSAEMVKSSGREMLIDPMPAFERRLIHMLLKDDPDVKTESRGEGAFRQVVILPANPGEVNGNK